MRYRVVAFLLVAVVLPAAPAHAASDPVKAVNVDYISDGVLSPCKHTVETLRATRKLIPPDIEQYAPDYKDAIDAALEAHARGECDKKGGSAGPTTTTPAAPSTAPEPSATPTPKPEATPAATPVPTTTVVEEPPAPAVAARKPSAADGRVERVVVAAAPANPQPAPVVWLAVVLGAMVLTMVGLLLVRTSPATRHAFGEAGYRLSGSWQDFLDFLRIGR